GRARGAQDVLRLGELLGAKEEGQAQLARARVAAAREPLARAKQEALDAFGEPAGGAVRVRQRERDRGDAQARGAAHRLAPERADALRVELRPRSQAEAEDQRRGDAAGARDEHRLAAAAGEAPDGEQLREPPAQPPVRPPGALPQRPLVGEERDDEAVDLRLLGRERGQLEEERAPPLARGHSGRSSRRPASWASASSTPFTKPGELSAPKRRASSTAW